MKRKTFIVFLIVALLVLPFFLFFLKIDYNGKRPVDQPNTTWKSECGRVEFTTDDGGAGMGVIILKDGSRKNIHFATGITNNIDIYECDKENISDIIDGELIEKWSGTFLSRNYFIAVVKETKYFEKGEKIIFKKIE